MLSNVKGFCKRNIKPIIVSMMISSMLVLSAIGASATDGATSSFDLTSVVETSIAELSAELSSLLGVIVPSAFLIMLGYVGAKKAMSWIKGLLGKI